MTQQGIKYRGFLIAWHAPRPTGPTYPVQITTRNAELRARLGTDANQTSQISFDEAVDMAKTAIDRLLDDGGLDEIRY